MCRISPDTPNAHFFLSSPSRRVIHGMQHGHFEATHIQRGPSIHLHTDEPWEGLSFHRKDGQAHLNFFVGFCMRFRWLVPSGMLVIHPPWNAPSDTEHTNPPLSRHATLHHYRNDDYALLDDRLRAQGILGGPSFPLHPSGPSKGSYVHRKNLRGVVCPRGF